MRKKWITPLLALALAAGLCLPALAAGPVVSVTPSSAAPAVGDEITVDVSIQGSPGFNAVQFTLTFDEAVLDCVSVSTGPVLRGALSAVNPDASAGAIVAAASADVLPGDGVLATFTFRVVGEGALDFGFADYVLADAEGTDIPFTLTGAEDLPFADQPGEPEQPEQPEQPGEPEQPGGSGGSEQPEQPGQSEQPGESGPEAGPLFSDTAGHWAEAYINAAAERGLFQGYEDGSFRPGNNVTRGEFVTVLWRLAGQPAAQAAPFADTAGVWCEQAVSWAYAQGYVNGRSAERFAPNDPVTRQEAMKILFLYNGGVSGQEALFTSIYDDAYEDSGDIASWAKAPVYWAVYNQLISGVTETTLDPQGPATRAQLAKILVSYLDTLGQTNP